MMKGYIALFFLDAAQWQQQQNLQSIIIFFVHEEL